MSDVRKFFISRYKEKGIILEADFSQLEIIFLAHITKDPQLIADITSGIDLHTVRAAELFGVTESDVTSDQRKIAKAFSFMLQYGSGAKHMAEETGHDLETAKKFIKNYYDRYPKVKEWQDSLIELVEDVAYNTKKKFGSFPARQSRFVSETGRMYTFTETPSPQFMVDRGKHMSFSPTTIKNYPIQGGATGDIVPMTLGKINRFILRNNLEESVHLIATVHDSILFDMPTKMCYDIGMKIKTIMEEAPNDYEKQFGVVFDLPLKVELKYGPNWGECNDVLS